MTHEQLQQFTPIGKDRNGRDMYFGSPVDGLSGIIFDTDDSQDIGVVAPNDMSVEEFGRYLRVAESARTMSSAERLAILHRKRE